MNINQVWNLLMRGYKWDKGDLKKQYLNQTTFYIRWFLCGGKSSLGWSLIPAHKQILKEIKSSFILGKYSLTFSILLLFICELNKWNCCKTCGMLVVGVINLCKGSFVTCIFYSITLKLYIQKNHERNAYSIFHDFVEIYSLVTSNFLFMMLEKCFSIAPKNFPKYIHKMKTHVECFSYRSRPTNMWSKVFY